MFSNTALSHIERDSLCDRSLLLMLACHSLKKIVDVTGVCY